MESDGPGRRRHPRRLSRRRQVAGNSVGVLLGGQGDAALRGCELLHNALASFVRALPPPLPYPHPPIPPVRDEKPPAPRILAVETRMPGSARPARPPRVLGHPRGRTLVQGIPVHYGGASTAGLDNVCVRGGGGGGGGAGAGGRRGGGSRTPTAADGVPRRWRRSPPTHDPHPRCLLAASYCLLMFCASVWLAAITSALLGLRTPANMPAVSAIIAVSAALFLYCSNPPSS
jgi:hypothetical protein